MFYNRVSDKNDKRANVSLQLSDSFIMNSLSGTFLICIKCLCVIFVYVAFVNMAVQLKNRNHHSNNIFKLGIKSDKCHYKLCFFSSLTL